LKSELTKNTMTITDPALLHLPAFAGLHDAIERFESVGAQVDAVCARADDIAARMEAAEANSLAIDATITDYETKRGAIAETLRVETPWTYISARASLSACSLRRPFSKVLG
jgi:hypothetical protein